MQCDAAAMQAKGVVGDRADRAMPLALAEERVGGGQCRFCHGKCKFCSVESARLRADRCALTGAVRFPTFLPRYFMAANTCASGIVANVVA